MEKTQLLEVLEKLSTDDLRDYVILGGKILERRVDRAITTTLEQASKVFGNRAVIRKTGKDKNGIQMQALPVALKSYMTYINNVEGMMLQLNNTQYLALSPHKGTEGFEVTHTFIMLPASYKFLTDAEDETMELNEVLSIHRDLNKS